MYTSTYTYMCTQTYVHMYTYIHIHTHMHIHIHIYIHIPQVFGRHTHSRAPLGMPAGLQIPSLTRLKP